MDRKSGKGDKLTGRVRKVGIWDQPRKKENEGERKGSREAGCSRCTE